MPRAYLMSWDQPSRRWKKMFKGKTYEVYCHQLPLPESEWTREGSYQAANEWWTQKKATLVVNELPIDLPSMVSTLKAGELFEAVQKGLAADHLQELKNDLEGQEGFDTEHDLNEYERRMNRVVKAEREEGYVSSLLKTFRSKPNEVVEEKLKLQNQLSDWLRLKKWKATTVLMSTSYVKEFSVLENNGVKILLPEMSVKEINEQKLTDVYLALDATDQANETKKRKFGWFKSFVSHLAETAVIDLPRNYNSKNFRFKIVHKQKELPELSKIKKFLDSLPDRLKLYALLAFNCGCNNTDIATLKVKSINWKEGTLTRRRNKTEDHERVPTVVYKLWATTAKLLKKEMAKEGELCLVDANGKKLYYSEVVNGKGYHYDKIKTSWRDWFGRGEKKEYTLKDFRDFGSMLLQNSEYRSYRASWLGHSAGTVAERHYSGVEDCRKACEYLESVVFE